MSQHKDEIGVPAYVLLKFLTCDLGGEVWWERERVSETGADCFEMFVWVELSWRF